MIATGDATEGTARATGRRPRGLQWPILILGLLALNVCVCAITVIAALRDPAVVEPGYYEKALNWDAHRGSTGSSAGSAAGGQTP